MKTIVWDMDDVLNDFTAAWLELGWRAEHPECQTSYDELKTNPPLTELQTGMDEYCASLDRFRLSTAAEKLTPHPAILEWFHQHGHQFRHHVLTARPVRTVAPGAAWVFDIFGKWIRSFHFVPSPRAGEHLPTYETNKSQVLARIGPVDFFVDDSTQNVAEAAQLGINAITFPQPWNGSRSEVSAILNQLTQKH